MQQKRWHLTISYIRCMTHHKARERSIKKERKIVIVVCGATMIKAEMLMGIIFHLSLLSTNVTMFTYMCDIKCLMFNFPMTWIFKSLQKLWHFCWCWKNLHSTLFSYVAGIMFVKYVCYFEHKFWTLFSNK